MRALRAAIVAAAFVGVASAQLTLYVNAQSGNDSWPGTSAQPLQRLTTALATPGVSNVFVQWSTVPIAPTGFGGVEPVFPIRMKRRVPVEGLPGPAMAKPVITLVESCGAPYAWPTLLACERKACVFGAPNCTLKNFALVGSSLFNKQADNNVGVFARDVQNFSLVDCTIDDFRDAVVFRETDGTATSCTVSGCTLGGALPLHPGSGSCPDVGHAAMWVESTCVDNGSITVTATNSVFRTSHDAIETDATENGSVTLNAVGCTFECNENGLEIVGKGTHVVTVTDCDFLNNYNKGIADSCAMPQPPATAAIAYRGEALVTMTVRGCLFQNNAVGVLWSPANSASVLDLGTNPDAGPGKGNNTFDLDWSLVPLPPYRTCLKYQGSVVTTVTAKGNRWIPLNQGADANGNLWSATPVCGPVAMPSTCPLLGSADRNYALDDAATCIDFGALPMMTLPAPPASQPACP